jgi:hypothetical protein
MSTVELSDDALEAARREADRRGVGVTDVVAEAVQRFVVGSDMQKLLAEFRRQDAESADALSEEEASRVAAEELASIRQRPS